MSAVNVKIPTQLRDTVSGESVVVTVGSTVGECLESLFVLHPLLKERICDDSGLRRFVNLYVGGEDVRFLDGLETQVAAGSEITILPAVAGGS